MKYNFLNLNHMLNNCQNISDKDSCLKNESSDFHNLNIQLKMNIWNMDNMIYRYSQFDQNNIQIHIHYKWNHHMKYMGFHISHIQVIQSTNIYQYMSNMLLVQIYMFHMDKDIVDMMMKSEQILLCIWNKWNLNIQCTDHHHYNDNICCQWDIFLLHMIYIWMYFQNKFHKFHHILMIRFLDFLNFQTFTISIYQNKSLFTFKTINSITSNTWIFIITFFLLVPFHISNFRNFQTITWMWYQIIWIITFVTFWIITFKTWFIDIRWSITFNTNVWWFKIIIWNTSNTCCLICLTRITRRSTWVT